MKGKTASRAMALSLVISVNLAALPIKGTSELDAQPKSTGDEPIVRVVTPKLHSFVVGGTGSSRIIVAIEIIDVSGAGIVTSESGEPRFVSPNRNVNRFLRFLIQKGTYTNGKGQSVTQLVAAIPVSEMQAGEFQITPPLDLRSIDPAAREKGLKISISTAVDAADFPFIVEDRNGTRSVDDRESTLYIGFASELYKPQPTPLSPEGEMEPGAPNSEGSPDPTEGA